MKDQALVILQAGGFGESVETKMYMRRIPSGITTFEESLKNS